MLDYLATGGTLTGGSAGRCNAIANDPALKAYYAHFTLPTVDGKAVGGRVGHDTMLLPLRTCPDDDACKAAATKALIAMPSGRADRAKEAQVAQITAVYAQRSSATKADVAPCKVGNQ